MTIDPTIEANFAALMEAHKALLDSGCNRGYELIEGDRYALIEKSRCDGSVWITTWASPEQAADYHDNQEYAEDWNIEALVDLRTNKAHQATTHTTFG